MISFFSIILGNCSASFDEGIVLKDEFHLSCSSWQDDHTPLEYVFYLLTKGITQILCKGKFLDCKTVLPIGPEENGYTYPVWITVTDQLGGSTKTSYNVTVSERNNIFDYFNGYKMSLTNSRGTKNLCNNFYVAGIYITSYFTIYNY